MEKRNLSFTLPIIKNKKLKEQQNDFLKKRKRNNFSRL